MSEKKPPQTHPDPAAVAAAEKAPPLRSLVATGRNNVWRVKVLDRDNNPVISDKRGGTTLILRGPASVEDLKKGAAILLNSKRADAMRAGLEDPGYHIDESSIEPAGHSDDDVGMWFPPGAKPVNLPTDAAAQAARDKLIAERLGVANPNP